MTACPSARERLGYPVGSRSLLRVLACGQHKGLSLREQEHFEFANMATSGKPDRIKKYANRRMVSLRTIRDANQTSSIVAIQSRREKVRRLIRTADLSSSALCDCATVSRTWLRSQDSPGATV